MLYLGHAVWARHFLLLELGRGSGGSSGEASAPRDQQTGGAGVSRRVPRPDHGHYGFDHLQVKTFVWFLALSNWCFLGEDAHHRCKAMWSFIRFSEPYLVRFFFVFFMHPCPRSFIIVKYVFHVCGTVASSWQVHLSSRLWASDARRICGALSVYGPVEEVDGTKK